MKPTFLSHFTPSLVKPEDLEAIFVQREDLEDLHDHLLIAWLREEEWGISSFLDQLLRIFRALRGEYSDP